MTQIVRANDALGATNRDTYLRFADESGAIMVRTNVEDTRNGVAEYVVEKYGDRVIIELKRGQGAKDIGGEIQLTGLGCAIFLKQRGYIVDPDPTRPYDVQAKVGVEAMKEIPFGAIAMWSLADKLGAGLQQFMAGARRFTVSAISRDDVVSANRETEHETGIPFITDALDQEARAILDS